MRTMILVELDTPTVNQHMTDGSMSKSLDEMMTGLKPEAVYFATRNGQRMATLVVDLPDSSSLVPMLEPLWLMNAKVEVLPCMNLDELRNGLSRLPH
ncbi:MAG: hypothetical protein ACRDVE_20655 [Actinocrinis sp.]